MSFDKARSEAEASLARGDAREAFSHLRSVLRYPGQLDDRQWPQALRLFGRVAAGIVGEEWARHVTRAADHPNDPDALYDLGYELIEQSLPDIAATVLSRASALSPGDERVLAEFVSALESDDRHDEACRVLRGLPQLLAASPVCNYLLGYNALMTGDLVTPRRVFQQIAPVRDETVQHMAGQLRQMLLRADAVRGVTPLDDKDLRGWHFVVNGSVLLHLSPFGFDEGMRGRYAFTQDSADRCLEGIRRVQAVLAAWRLRPPRVLLLPDRESAALGLAAANVLQVPAEPWAAKGTTAPGLIVSYDLATTLTSELAEQLVQHRPGQLLWSHAACWTAEPPFAADLVTYLYQFNQSPWGAGRLSVDPQTRQTVRAPEAPGSPRELAAQILAAESEPDALKDLPALKELAAAASRATGDAAAGAFLTSGQRRRQRTDSPVKSSRFH